MRTTAEQRRRAEQRIRAAADALLRGDIPPGRQVRRHHSPVRPESPALPSTAPTRT